MWFIVAVMVAFIVAIALLVPEKSAPGKTTDIPPLPFLDPRIRAFVLYAIVVNFAYATPLQTAAFFFIDQLGFSATDVAQFVGVGLSAAALAALFAQLVIVQRFRVPPWFLMLAGAALLGLAQLLMAFSTSFAPMTFALMLNGLGAGLAIPGFGAGASLAVGPEQQGAIAGITGAMTAAGFCLVPIINLTLYRVDPAAPYLFDALLMGALFVFTLRSPSMQQRQSD
ncbi:MAG: MFS transporter [Pseudomonadota bacterium]